jgi:hypothetical protein
MVRRVPVEKKVDGDVRDTLSSWLAWGLIRAKSLLRLTVAGMTGGAINSLNRLNLASNGLRETRLTCDK